MSFILYKLKFPNGKCYIGQTVRKMSIRISQHRTAANRGSMLPVHCAWRKHGEPSVGVMSEYECAEDLHQAEIAAIQDVGTLCPNGYNLGFGGETAPSTNPDVAQRIREKAIGRKIDNAERRSEIATELWQSEDYRANMSASLKAAWTDERREATSAKFKKMWAKRKEEDWSMSEATKKKLRNAPVSDEARAKMSAAAKKRKRKPVSDETREKLSARAKEAWQDKELTERRISAIRRAKQGAKNEKDLPH